MKEVGGYMSLVFSNAIKYHLDVREVNEIQGFYNDCLKNNFPRMPLKIIMGIRSNLHEQTINISPKRLNLANKINIIIDNMDLDFG